MEYFFQNESLSVITEFVLKEMKPVIEEKGITLDFKQPDFDDHMEIDVDKITQVITNLLSNAIKFSDNEDLTV